MSFFSIFIVYISIFLLLSIFLYLFFFFFSSRRRHTRCGRDWSSDVCSSDLRCVPPTTSVMLDWLLLIWPVCRGPCSLDRQRMIHSFQLCGRQKLRTSGTVRSLPSSSPLDLPLSAIERVTEDLGPLAAPRGCLNTQQPSSAFQTGQAEYFRQASVWQTW